MDYTLDFEDWLHRQDVGLVARFEPVEVYKVNVEIFCFEIDGVALDC